MSTSRSIGEEPAVFAHQVRALLARQRREDEEAIGGPLKRSGFRAPLEEREVRRAHRRPIKSGRGGIVDFHAASPLTRRDRQTGIFRVPHFDVKAVVAIHPPSRNGVAHPRCSGGGMSAAGHFDYVTAGARIGLAKHIDYIRRETGVDDPAGELLLDMLDEQEARAAKNQLACYTNIPGGWDRARSLFEAAERAAPPPKTHLLKASTAQVTSFEYQLKFGDAPAWFREMTRRLQAEAAEVERRATERGSSTRHHTVTLAEVSSEEAFDRLDWLERRPFAAGLVSWKQGRTQRSQHRFVGELPDGLSPIERHEILSRFCEGLAEDGWMVVGAIHQPDRHNDRRNFHIHVDGVDRPAVWLDKQGCWDFEHVKRRNGKDTRPFRQNKVRYDAPPAGLLRERFITIVNGVVGDRTDVVRFLHGTYADNEIALTPLEHLGNRATGLEARGGETEIGSRNARRIFADEAAACEKRATDAEAALASELDLIRAVLVGNRDALAAVARYERLERRLIRRRLQRELAEVVIVMARSRAETVVHTLTPTPGCPVTPRNGDAELLAGAAAHLEWVDRHTPARREQEAARRAEEALAARAADEMRIIEAATIQLGSRERQDVIVYMPRDRSPVAAAPPSRFDDQKRNRLLAWLRKHADEAGMLILEDGIARLAKGVPQSIDTLMGRFASEPRFQRLLLTERQRRADREIMSGPTPSGGAPRGLREARMPPPIVLARPSSMPSIPTARTHPIAEVSGSVPASIDIPPTPPIVAAVVSPTSAQRVHLAAPQARRETEGFEEASSQIPEQSPRSDAELARSPTTRDAPAAGFAQSKRPRIQQPRGVLAQVPTLSPAGMKMVAPKGPAGSSAPIAPRTKAPER